VLLPVLGVGVTFLLIAMWWVGRTPGGVISLDEEARYREMRKSLVQNQLVPQGIKDAAVLAAMEKVPRHRFVPASEVTWAYDDRALPIGFGQTISQPYIVALMTELLQVRRGQRILEVGTGSGYQAAILAELTDEVYTVEIIPELARQAEERLRELGYANVRFRTGDGYYGWEDHAPYDGIIVTCAPDHVPPPLIKQLKDGGRLVIPVGPPGFYQSLWLVEKTGDKIVTREITGVVFVPLTGTH
jgi:protein-L-isoaspartate(D-aspartate) O-methyltransferase